MSDRDFMLSLLRVPEASTVHFGCRPHMAATEGRMPDPRTGLAPSAKPRHKEGQPRGTCTECGGMVLDDGGNPFPALGGADPVGVHHLHVAEHAGSKRKAHRGAARISPIAVVCGGCMRSSYDGTRALERAVKSPLEGDPTAAKATRAKFRPRGQKAG